jgi:hypothetical protein
VKRRGDLRSLGNTSRLTGHSIPSEIATSFVLAMTK